LKLSVLYDKVIGLLCAPMIVLSARDTEHWYPNQSIA